MTGSDALLRKAAQNLLDQPVFIGDEGFEPTLVAVSAGHLAALRAALDATEPEPSFEEGWRAGRNAGITEVIDRLADASRWIDSLHEEYADKRVWTTKNELRSWLVIQPAGFGVGRPRGQAMSEPSTTGECPTCHGRVTLEYTQHRQNTIVGVEEWTETRYHALSSEPAGLDVERLANAAYEAWRDADYPVAPWPRAVFEGIVTRLNKHPDPELTRLYADIEGMSESDD